MINHDQVLDFGVPEYPMFGPIQFLFIAREFFWNLNWIRKLSLDWWAPMTMTHDLPTLPLSWSFHPWWQLAGPASSSFLEEMGLPQTSPNSKTMVIHQLGTSARAPSFSKVTLFVGISGSQRLQPTQTPGMMDDLTDWVAFTFWEVSLVYFTNSFARHHPFLCSSLAIMSLNLRPSKLVARNVGIWE